MSSLGIDQMYLLAKKFKKMDWDSERVTQLGQAPENHFRDFEAIMDGRATVTINLRLTTPTTFTMSAVKKPKRLKDCEGVWLANNATALFATVSQLSSQKRREASHCDLIKNLNDFEIIKDLSGEEVAVFASVETLEATISQLVTKQAGGKSGELLNDGKANIFYARDPNNSGRVLCVSVDWYCDGSKWSVSSSEVGTYRWHSGFRVFLDN